MINERSWASSWKAATHLSCPTQNYLSSPVIIVDWPSFISPFATDTLASALLMNKRIAYLLVDVN
jgi:hypothetical protein